MTTGGPVFAYILPVVGCKYLLMIAGYVTAKVCVLLGQSVINPKVTLILIKSLVYKIILSVNAFHVINTGSGTIPTPENVVKDGNVAWITPRT